MSNLQIVDGEEIGGTVKTAAQKKKEKKEKQKQKLAEEKQKAATEEKQAKGDKKQKERKADLFDHNI